MQSQGTGESQSLGVTTLADQIVHFVAVTHMGNGLFNDRAGIKVFGDVMGRGTDDFYLQNKHKCTS